MKNPKATEQFLTIQGEGKSVGQLAYFIRLAGCNLWCEWCDSMHSVDPKIYRELAQNIDFSAFPSNCHLFVITGGEPLVHDLNPILKQIVEFNPSARIEIETNGTVFPKIYQNNVFWNVSIKLKSSRQKTLAQDQLRLQSIAQWSDFASQSGRVCFKFVIADESDVVEVTNLAHEFKINPNDIFLMAEGQTRESQDPEKLKPIIDRCKDLGFNFSPRLHIMIWDTKKGV